MLRNTRLAIPILLLAALFLFISPPQASAKVHFGIYVGPPAYTYPAYPYAYGYPYSYPYTYSYPYPEYGYGYRVYSYPRYYGRGYYGRGWERHERREHRGYRR